MRRLDERFVDTIETPGRYGDGRGGYGLSLLVKSRSGGGVTKSFAQRLRVNGKPRNIGLGPYPAVSLQEARDMAKDNASNVRKASVTRRVNALLGDTAPVVQPAPRVVVPMKASPTVREAAEQVIAIHRAGWKAGSPSEKNWRTTLETYVLPRIGDRPVSEVTSADVMDVLTPIWGTKRETAKRTKQRIGAIMDWSVSMGFRPDNPTASIGAALPKNGVHVKHHAALSWPNVPEALSKVRASTSKPLTKLAFEFLVLTALRSGEVRGLQWEWEDTTGQALTIPAAAMKMNRPHKVPLSTQANAILLEALKHFDGRSRLIFPASDGRPLSDMTFAHMLRKIEVDATPHGFRSSFRNWAAERTDAPREVAELALAHVEGSETEKAYFRTDLFERHRELMQQWADFVSP